MFLAHRKVEGYKGHHINIVKNNPHLAADPNNIEFVTDDEYLDRHNGNYHNPTNGSLIERN